MPEDIYQLDEIDRLMIEYQHARSIADKAIAAQHDAQNALIEQLALRGIKSHEFDGHRATVVKSSTYVFDEKGLRKAVGARSYNKWTTAKLDRKKLEKAVEAGDLDPVVLASYATEKEGAPYIRLTEKK